MSNFNKPFYSIEINFIDLKESIYIHSIHFYNLYSNLSPYLSHRSNKNFQPSFHLIYHKKKEITSNLSSHLHKPHNKPFPSTPCNTSKTFSRRGEEKKKGKKGWRVKFSARNKFTGKVVAVKVKERRNGARMGVEGELKRGETAW